MKTELITIDKGLPYGTITKDERTTLADVQSLQAKIIVAMEQKRAKIICDTQTLLMVEITLLEENLWQAGTIN